jgi:phenylpropionate dioxygenase-like ring-hydroxylating dioxygenase large terminal subunit
MQIASLRELIDRQRPGWSLEQPFYISDELYEFERREWLAEQWYVLAHCSELPAPGTLVVRELLGESIIIVRDSEGVLRGFYNVCRHRGSRICTQDGRATSLVCPYHAWSYRLDGTLRAAAALPEGTDVKQLGLRAIPVREIGGIIIGSLAGDLQSLDVVQHALEPGLRYHGVSGARVAARRSYPTRGNWKLVMENFTECYHCVPSHSEYSSVMKHVDELGRDAPNAAAAWRKTVETWFREEADRNSPLQLWPTGLPSLKLPPDLPRCEAGRVPIDGSRKTQSEDGKPVAPLMGQQLRFDGGVSFFWLPPFVCLFALNDHAVLFQFLPTGPQITNVVITWLVNSSAPEADVDVDRMIWLWDVTTRQDKVIIEENAVGIRSQSYAPGPYSLLEFGPAHLMGSYLRELSVRCDGFSLGVTPRRQDFAAQR